MKIFKSCLAISLAAVMVSNVSQAMQFEGFYADDYSNQRVGLDYHNGNYGKKWTGSQWIGKIGEEDATPYNRWFQAGIHNAYEHDNDPDKKGLYGFLQHSSSLIELDIYADNGEDWIVQHFSGDNGKANCKGYLPQYSGNPVQTGVKLSDCLQAIRAFHDDFPNHHPITLWIELKDKNVWGDHSDDVVAFNQLLTQKLGDDFIFDQAEFKGNYPNLRAAANGENFAGGWPTLGELNGKILVVVFGHRYSNQLLLDYEQKVLETKKAFVAPTMYGLFSGNKTGNVDKPTKFESEQDKNRVIFYSLQGRNYADQSYGLDIFRNNRVSATYYADNPNEPGVSEYRDFLIQQGRWGSGKNDLTLNGPEQYSGRMIAESAAMVPAVAQLQSANNPGYCMQIESSSISNKADLIIAPCNNSSAQKFAIIDAAIDVSGAHDFPQSRGYILQAVIGGNTQDPNEKVIEVKNRCCDNTADGKEVFQHSREDVDEKNRPEDQYWHIETNADGSIMFRNVNSGKYLDVSTSDAEQDATPNTSWEWLPVKASSGY